MSTATSTSRPGRNGVLSVLAELGSNVKLTTGLVLVLSLVAVAIIGPLLVDTEMARPISAPTNRPPSPDYLLGTDGGGRDLLAVIVASTPQTLRLGLLAGLIGTLVAPSSALSPASSVAGSIASFRLRPMWCSPSRRWRSC